MKWRFNIKLWSCGLCGLDYQWKALFEEMSSQRGQLSAVLKWTSYVGWPRTKSNLNAVYNHYLLEMPCLSDNRIVYIWLSTDFNSSWGSKLKFLRSCHTTYINIQCENSLRPISSRIRVNGVPQFFFKALHAGRPKNLTFHMESGLWSAVKRHGDFEWTTTNVKICASESDGRTWLPVFSVDKNLISNGLFEN